MGMEEILKKLEIANRSLAKKQISSLNQNSSQDNHSKGSTENLSNLTNETEISFLKQQFEQIKLEKAAIKPFRSVKYVASQCTIPKPKSKIDKIFLLKQSLSDSTRNAVRASRKDASVQNTPGTRQQTKCTQICDNSSLNSDRGIDRVSCASVSEGELLTAM